MMLAVTMAGCLVVGLLIGWSGVAGFLLPILFVNYCRLDTTQALALSFLCFALSGIISSVNYRRKGQLDFRTALPLSAGSLIGAAAGAALNRLQRRLANGRLSEAYKNSGNVRGIIG